VENACEEKKGRTGNEIQKNVLANGSLFGPICIEQAHAVPTGSQANMNLWYSTLRLYQPKNRNIIQRFQNRVIRGIVDAPWYIRNDSLHKDQDMETVDSVIRKYAQSHEQRLHRHINVEALQLLNNGGLVKRLKRTKPFELV
jgi:hypothetical protein